MKLLRITDFFGVLTLGSYIGIRNYARIVDASIGTYLYLHAYVLFPILLLSLLGLSLYFFSKDQKAHGKKGLIRFLFWLFAIALCLAVFRCTK